MRKLNGIVFAFVFLVFLSTILLGHAYAQTPAPVVQPENPEVEIRNVSLQKDAPMNASKYGENNFIVNETALLCQLSGGASGCVNSDGSPRADSGAFGHIIGFIGDMYRYKAASTDKYVASVLQDMHVTVTGAQPVYAQGLGFSALDPILEVWKIFRNIAYMAFIVIFLVIGFMIMFRQKIGSQAVVTAQQAIPSIVVALLTVTFSYAIAGLLIDLMYLTMYFLAGMFTKLDPNLINGNIFQVSWHLLLGGAASDAADVVGKAVTRILGDTPGASLPGFLANLTAGIIIWLVIVFNSFKLFFALLKVFVDIILNIAFAPVILMMGAIPGQNAFGPWVRNLTANLAVFPGILLLLIIFQELQQNVSQASGGFNPPYIGGIGSGANLAFLAGLALILALPQAVDEIKKALGASQSGIFGTLIQAGIKNAQDRFGTGKRVMGMAGLGILGATGGALAANYVSSKIPSQQSHRTRNTLLAGAAGAALPLGLPILKGVSQTGVALGQTVYGANLALRGAGGVFPEAGAEAAKVGEKIANKTRSLFGLGPRAQAGATAQPATTAPKKRPGPVTPASPTTRTQPRTTP